MIWSARLLSFFMGFLSLSQEILWVRMAGFAYRGAPQAFGAVLGVYLLGIALGAGLGKRYCDDRHDLLKVTAWILLVAAALDVLLPWLTTAAFGAGRAAGSVMLAVAVLLTATLKSMVFPIAHHLGSSSQAASVGSSVSKVYFANVIGSTLGPLVTGFFILEWLTLQQSMMLMAGLTLSVAALCLLARSEARAPMPIRTSALTPAFTPTRRRLWPGMALAASAGLTLLLLSAPNAMMARLVNHTGNHEGPFKSGIENRYGIIHVLHDLGGDDYIFGGNVYDGRINTDFLTDSNWVSRVYFLAALQPQPKRILVVGMSAGSWTRVLTAFPGVESIDVVEINPGYVQLVQRYQETRPVLKDPRVKLHFDDGRRWMKRHPDQTFDMIVMNTTYHYRAYSTLLLSREFLEMARSRLRPGGLLAYNSTYAWDVFKTAATVFPSVYRYGNFVLAGESISPPPPEVAFERIAALRVDGKPLVDPSNGPTLDKLRSGYRLLRPYSEKEFEQLAGRPLEVITDQNMITEYRYGESVLKYFGKARKPVTTTLSLAP